MAYVFDIKNKFPSKTPHIDCDTLTRVSVFEFGRQIYEYLYSIAIIVVVNGYEQIAFIYFPRLVIGVRKRAHIFRAGIP